MRVLLVEDDDRIAEDAVAALFEAGFVVVREREGEAGWVTGGTDDFAAIILDLGLPDIDGLTILKRWREEGLRTPVLVLTARGSWLERVEGIDAGADDYLPKPFHMEELIARLRALVRRAAGIPSSLFKCGELIIDKRQTCVIKQGRPVLLTPQEFRALNYLVTNCGRTVSTSELIEHVHGDSDAVSANAMEALIGRIRRKLGAELIETRRGCGYVVPGG
jgi:two-component system, OmpR family, response regulator